MKTTISYEVHYTWYRYNTGYGDNGHVSASRSFTTETEARAFIDQVNSSADFRAELMERDGFIVKVDKLICVARHELFLEEQPVLN